MLNLLDCDIAGTTLVLHDATDIDMDAIHDRIVRMAQVYGEKGLGGNHRGGVRGDLQHADGELDIGRIGCRLINRHDHSCRHEESIAALMALGSPGVRSGASDTHPIATRSLDACDDTDRNS